MRIWVKVFMFISAYTPLFLILILRHIKFNLIYFWIAIFILIFINLFFAFVFKASNKWNIRNLTIKSSVNRTNDALNYIIAYIIAFLDFKFDKWQGWTTLIILLAVIFFIYINSNLIFVNPLLNVFGYKIYDVEVFEKGHIVLITKKNIIKENEKIEVKNLSDNIYKEVIYIGKNED